MGQKLTLNYLEFQDIGTYSSGSLCEEYCSNKAEVVPRVEPVPGSTENISNECLLKGNPFVAHPAQPHCRLDVPVVHYTF